MLKMFDNCKALSFVKQNKGINGMTSSEGEPYEMKAVVPVEGAVELWMTGVEAEMQRSLQIITKEATYVVLACHFD
jgi:dynein heavy chain